MVIHEGILFDTPILIASILDATNSNCGPTINVSWTAVTGAVYQLERRVNGGAWAVVYIGTGLSFSESGNPGLYEYRVKVIKGSKSAYSNIDGVTVVAQNSQVNTYCVGYDLWQTFTSGCGLSTRLLQPLSPSCGVVYGCTDPTSNNYNPNATHSNGSCEYGCEDCGYPKFEIFTQQQSAVIALASRPASGQPGVWHSYTITLNIARGAFTCFDSLLHWWSGTAPPPLWSDSVWVFGGPMSLTPSDSRPYVEDYTLTDTTLTLTIADKRDSSDSANYIYISRVTLGTC